MIYKRLYNGNLIMHSLCGSHPHPFDPATAATAVADQLRQVLMHPNRIWDIAHVLKQHGEAAVTASATAIAAASTSAAAAAVENAAAEAAEVAEPGAGATNANGTDAQLTASSPGDCFERSCGSKVSLSDF